MNWFNRYSYDDQKIYATLVRNYPQVREIERNEHLRYYLALKPRTLVVSPISSYKQNLFQAKPVPSKTFVHYSFSELCCNILKIQKMSVRQGIHIDSIMSVRVG